jgi:hypothetical protein
VNDTLSSAEGEQLTAFLLYYSVSKCPFYGLFSAAFPTSLLANLLFKMTTKHSAEMLASDPKITEGCDAPCGRIYVLDKLGSGTIYSYLVNEFNVSQSTTHLSIENRVIY